MADYITTLLDDNEVDTLSPTTTFPALRDANGNYLDNTLAASDLNAAKNGKILDLVNNKVNKSDIADNLTTNDSTKVLSAKQGKILNDSINAISLSSFFRYYGSSYDFNTIGTAFGFCSGMANYPDGRTVGMFISLKDPNTSWCSQFFIEVDSNTPNTYVRSYQGSWSNWKKLQFA